MHGEDITDEFRRVMGDTTAPYLWTDEEILTYASDAEKEACERALLIEDHTTPEVCALALATAVADYELHASVLHVKRVTYLGRALEETSIEAEDRNDPLWESRTGAPKRFIQTEGSLRFVPTPTSAENGAAVALTAYRLPLKAIAEDADSPEIHVRYHMRLMPWVYRCALLKQDSETMDAARAQVHEGRFIEAFGERPDANVHRKRRDRRPPVTRMVW